MHVIDWPVSFTFFFTLVLSVPYPHYVVSLCSRTTPTDLHVFVLPSCCYYLAHPDLSSALVFQLLLKKQLPTLILCQTVIGLRLVLPFPVLNACLIFTAVCLLDTNFACPLLGPCFDPCTWIVFGSQKLPGPLPLCCPTLLFIIRLSEYLS